MREGQNYKFNLVLISQNKHMKKYIGVLIAGVLALSALSVSAENNGLGDLSDERNAFREEMQAKRETFRTELEAKREAFRAEVEARKEEWKTANRERRTDFWNKAKRMLGERFEMAMRNLERMQTRVGELIDKLNEEGEDTGAATEFLNLSKDKLAEAKVKIDEIKALLPPDGEKITPEIFKQIKLKAREAKDLLKESHNALKDTIQEIKNLKTNDDDADDDDSE